MGIIWEMVDGGLAHPRSAVGLASDKIGSRQPRVAAQCCV
jgi:hypothetical protein